MILFLVGVVEMLIVTVWTKFVTGRKILASGAMTMINILIWYYVLQTVLAQLGNWQIVLLYASGCALGTMIAGYFFDTERPKEQGALSTPESASAVLAN